MPDSRLVAVGLMGMLSFGVVVGSIASPTIAGIASAPLILVERAVGISDSSGSSSDSGSGGGGGGAVGTTTVTVTAGSPAPAQAAAPLGSSAAPSVSPSGVGNSPVMTSSLPPVKHMFVIVLTDHGFNQTFSPVSKDTYLSQTLTKQGKLIEHYYAVAASPLANEIALVSGQGPTRQTAVNCPFFTPIRPAKRIAEQQVVGSGCVYPPSTETVAGQLTRSHLTWKAYVQDMGTRVRGAQASCRRPRLGSADPNQVPGPNRTYLTWRNPFVYFSSLTKTSQCSGDDVGLNRLAADLGQPSRAPALAYIVANACDDGSERPCAPRAQAGLPAADKFLKAIIPRIESSPAYKDNGLIAITFDQAPQTGSYADSSACCNPPAYPNLAARAGTTAPTTGSTTTPTGATPTGPTATSTTAALITAPVSLPAPVTTTASSTTTVSTTTTASSTTTAPVSTGTGQTSSTGGGGQVGLLLISSFIKPGTIDVIDYYNHFSLLGSIETLFALKRLGYASDVQLPVLDRTIFDGKP